MQVTEDFLQEEYYEHINELITSTTFPWMFQNRVANITEDPEEDLNHYYFVHSLIFNVSISRSLYPNYET